MQKNYPWNPSTCACENDEYLGSLINDSAVTCDEIIEPIKIRTTNLGNKKATFNIDIATFCVFFLINYYITIDNCQ